MAQLQKEAGQALELSKESMKKYYDRKKKDAREYKEGDLVWVEGTNIRTEKPNKKMDDKRYGPFHIEKKIGASAFKLKLPVLWKGIHPMFNESLLYPYVEPTFPNQETSHTMPPLVDQPDAVDEILDSRERKNGLQYLVHWTGKPRSENTWEPRSGLLRTSKDLLDRFHKDHPNAPKPPSIHIPQRVRFSETVEVAEGPDDQEWEKWGNIYQRWQERKKLHSLLLHANLEPDAEHVILPTRLNIGHVWFCDSLHRVRYIAVVNSPSPHGNKFAYPIQSVLKTRENIVCTHPGARLYEHSNNLPLNVALW